MKPSSDESIRLSWLLKMESSELESELQESFIPKPEVTSSVIKFEILNKPRVEVKDEKEFFRLIKIAFFQKRKTLVNALLNGGVFKSREEIENILEKIGLDNKVRGEKLTLEDYKKISEYL